jgi:hypothetical protein
MALLLSENIGFKLKAGRKGKLGLTETTNKAVRPHPATPKNPVPHSTNSASYDEYTSTPSRC